MSSGPSIGLVSQNTYAWALSVAGTSHSLMTLDFLMAAQGSKNARIPREPGRHFIDFYDPAPEDTEHNFGLTLLVNQPLKLTNKSQRPRGAMRCASKIFRHVVVVV